MTLDDIIAQLETARDEASVKLRTETLKRDRMHQIGVIDGLDFALGLLRDWQERDWKK